VVVFICENGLLITRFCKDSFDPLGFISPITARVKSIFQMLCKDKNDWDSKMSSDVMNVWERFLVELETYEDLRIKRLAFIEIRDEIRSGFVTVLCNVIAVLCIYKFLPRSEYAFSFSQRKLMLRL